MCGVCVCDLDNEQYQPAACIKIQVIIVYFPFGRSVSLAIRPYYIHRAGAIRAGVLHKLFSSLQQWYT